MIKASAKEPRFTVFSRFLLNTTLIFACVSAGVQGLVGPSGGHGTVVSALIFYVFILRFYDAFLMVMLCWIAFVFYLVFSLSFVSSFFFVLFVHFFNTVVTAGMQWFPLCIPVLWLSFSCLILCCVLFFCLDGEYHFNGGFSDCCSLYILFYVQFSLFPFVST